MGTRHLIVVYYKGEYHIAQYGQNDGFPSAQGLVALRFVSNPEKVAKLKAVLDNADTMLYTPTDAQVDAWQREMNDAYRAHFVRYRTLTTDAEREEWNNAGYHLEAKICPSINAYTCAEILDVVANAVPTEPVPIVKEMEFVADSLFCEFVYVVDLDANVLEVYSGSWCKPIRGRYATRFMRVKCLKDKQEHLPPMVGKFVFSDLPDEDAFVKAL